MTTTARVSMFISGAVVSLIAFCGIYMASAFGGLGAANPNWTLGEQLGKYLSLAGTMSIGSFPLLTGGLFLCVKAVRKSPFTKRVLRHLAIAVLLTVGVHLLLTVPVMGAIGLSWANQGRE